MHIRMASPLLTSINAGLTPFLFVAFGCKKTLFIVQLCGASPPRRRTFTGFFTPSLSVHSYIFSLLPTELTAAYIGFFFCFILAGTKKGCSPRTYSCLCNYVSRETAKSNYKCNIHKRNIAKCNIDKSEWLHRQLLQM